MCTNAKESIKYIIVFLCIFSYHLLHSIIILYSHPWVQPYKGGNIINNLTLIKDEIGNSNNTTPPSLLGIRGTLLAEYGLFNLGTFGILINGEFYGVEEKLKIYDSSVALSEVKAYYKQRIFDINGFILSIEPGVKMPAFYQRNNLGNYLYQYNTDATIDMKVSLGYSYHDYIHGFPGMSHGEGFFMYISALYQHRTVVPIDMLKIEGVFGVNLGEYMTLIAQFTKIYQILFEDNNAYRADSYHLFLLTVYIVTHMNKSLSLALGLNFDIGLQENNISPTYTKGSGVTLGIWFKF